MRRRSHLQSGSAPSTDIRSVLDLFNKWPPASRESSPPVTSSTGVSIPRSRDRVFADGFRRHPALRKEHEIVAQIIQPGKQAGTTQPSGSAFDSATSFAMIRGGHADIAILGVMQASVGGDLANGMIAGRKIVGTIAMERWT